MTDLAAHLAALVAQHRSAAAAARSIGIDGPTFYDALNHGKYPPALLAKLGWERVVIYRPKLEVVLGLRPDDDRPATGAAALPEQAPAKHPCAICKKPGYWYDDMGSTLCPGHYLEACKDTYGSD